MKAEFAVLLAVVAGVALAAITPEMVEKINSVQSEWKASMETPLASKSADQIDRLLGIKDIEAMWAHKVGEQLPMMKFSAAERLAAPASFDPREKWPQCDTLNDVRDQSDCGSCWAFGSTEFISDRQCIHKGEIVRISAEDMNSCSGAGSCQGGYPSSAVAYWKKTGLVSDDCRPYSLPGCDHHVPGSLNPCNHSYPTPHCIKQCLPASTKEWNSDKHKASKTYTVAGEEDMMVELSTNGPCEGAFQVYEDFEAYTGGVYKHVTGKNLGGHAIKVLGYGEDNGVKYWLIANSWNPHWGEKGMFRIRRGNNECGIENEIYCGIPA